MFTFNDRDLLIDTPFGVSFDDVAKTVVDNGFGGFIFKDRVVRCTKDDTACSLVNKYHRAVAGYEEELTNQRLYEQGLVY